MTPMRVAAIIVGALVFAAGLMDFSAAQAPAPTSETVMMGAVGIVARGPKLTETAKPKHGQLTKITETKPPGDDVLIYYAPVQPKEYEDEFRYKSADGPEKIVKVAVRSAPTLAGGPLYTESFKALFALFVLAVLVESALAMLFRWRPYVDSINSRGANAIVATVVAYILVTTFNLDITTTLVNVYTGANFISGTMGQFLTALIIAGGSAGVNRIFRALGFREIVRPEAEVAKPPPNDAWLAVIHRLGDTTGPVNVVIEEGAEASTRKKSVASSIPPSTGEGWFTHNFLRNRGRFPPSGGHVLTPGTTYIVYLEGETTKDGKPVTVRSDKWGPYSVVKGAVIDLKLTPRIVK